MKILFFLISMVVFGCKANTKETYSKETRQVVVVIDSGVSSSQATKSYMCSKPTLNFTDSPKKYDEHGHGTNIVSIISKTINPKTHCILAIKVWHPNIKNYQVENATIAAWRIANRIKSKYVNVSMDGSHPIRQEFQEIVQFLKQGGILTVAAGNHKINLNKNCKAFPSCYRTLYPHKNFHVVGSSDTSYSNFGNVVTDIEQGTKVGLPVMSGTSQASAIKMSKILKSVVLNNRRR